MFRLCNGPGTLCRTVVQPESDVWLTGRPVCVPDGLLCNGHPVTHPTKLGIAIWNT